MKLVYAVDKISYNDKDHVGVVKKVESQMKLFNKNGIETSLCQYEWQGGYPQIQIEKDTDILYFRRIEPSVKMLRKLHELKRINPNIKMIMEIPTYPFGAEEKDAVSLKTKVNRLIGETLLKRYVDRIVLIAQQIPPKKLYGIPVLNVNNGIDFSNITVRKTDALHNEGIHLVCVSGCFFWHGYDRIIEGMHRYYTQDEAVDDVYLHVVGEGVCLSEYKELADKYGLTDKYVFFYGRKVGKELDEIFDKCDIALESLGAHRKEIYMSSSLKTREYAAKGIPIASAVKIDIQNEKTKQYILMLPADEEPVSIEEIISFYHRIYDGKEYKNVAEEIRECFYPYCDWEFVFGEVIEYIK